jgi:hypothetical protein
MVAISGVKLGLFTDEYGSIFEETAQQFGALYAAQVPQAATKLMSRQNQNPRKCPRRN